MHVSTTLVSSICIRQGSSNYPELSGSGCDELYCNLQMWFGYLIQNTGKNREVEKEREKEWEGEGKEKKG